MSAIAAIKGYRTQFLYSLYRIITDKNTDYVYRLEGLYEDLDILDSNGSYIECLQVKNTTDTLSFSNLFSKKDSFFNRAISVISANHNVKVRIVSYGEVSNELADLSILRTKLGNKSFLGNNYSSDNIELILDHYDTPEQVNEDVIYQAIQKELKVLNPFLDIKITIELLLMRMFILAEQQIPTTYKSLNDGIECVGKFIAEREDFYTEFARTIIPLSTKSIENEDVNILRGEYYLGASARYEHILADIDVVRSQKIDEINVAFEKNKIVFIHGASGQGKSTLAYRYLHNELLDETVYELKLSNDYNEVYRTINVLNSLCKGLNVPVVIYIDVQPGHQHWNEVLKELSTKMSLKFLVTLRQETWNATTLGVDYNFASVELSFDEIEAEEIYNSLCSYKEDLNFVNFGESWSLFGGSGSLLEYIYFINQGDKLKKRLSEQVYHLQTQERVSELKILRYVALADSFEAKIDYHKLLSSVGIDIELAQRYIKNLEKEYLLRFSRNSKFITGLHSVRSKLLFEILFDDDEYIAVGDYISKTIFFIDESDIHSFLLYSFSKDYDVETLFSTLNNTEWSLSYVGIKNILQALIWKGACDFVFIHNFELLRKLHSLFNSGWFLGMPYDYTGANEPIYESLKDQFGYEKVSLFRSIASEFSPKDVIYSYAKRFICNLNNQNASPLSQSDVSSMGYLLFWVGYLECNFDLSNISGNKLIQYASTNHSSIDDLSELILGLTQSKFDEDAITDIREITVAKVRKRYSISYLDVDKELTCEYLLNLSEFENNVKEIGGSINYYNDVSVRVLSLFRLIYPHCSKYNTKCIGMDTLSTIVEGENFYNDQSLKMISKKNMPIKYLLTVNQLIINLFDYHNRPKTWANYASKFINIRHEYNQIAIGLISGFDYLSKKRDVRELNKVYKSIVNRDTDDAVFIAPKIVSDRWGYEPNASILNNNSQSEQLKGSLICATVMQPYTFLKAVHQDYISSITNFFNQCAEFVYKKNNGVHADPNLATYNLKSAGIAQIQYSFEFDRFFSKYDQSEKGVNLSLIERQNIIDLFVRWKLFVNDTYMSGRTQSQISKTIAKTKNDLSIGIERAMRAANVRKNKIVTKNRVLYAAFELDCNDVNYSLLKPILTLRNSFASDPFSLKRLLIEICYDSIVFIPLINGKMISTYAMKVPSTMLTDDKDQIKDLLHDFTYEVNDDIISYLNLISWSDDSILLRNYQIVQSIMISINQLLSQIVEFESAKVDEYGRRIIDDCITQYHNAIHNYKKEAITSLVTIRTWIDDNIYNQAMTIFSRSNQLDDANNITYISNYFNQNIYLFIKNLESKIVP